MLFLIVSALSALMVCEQPIAQVEQEEPNEEPTMLRTRIKLDERKNVEEFSVRYQLCNHFLEWVDDEPEE